MLIRLITVNILTSLLQLVSVRAQDTLSTDYLQPYTTYFEINNAKVSGNGSAIIQEEIKQSQFVSIGETHYSRRVSEFTDAVLKLSADNGYTALALETGPYSAEKLESLIEEKAERNLSELFDKFGSKLLFRFPIPFVAGKEDVTWLETARDRNYALWGIDYEYYDAAPYLFQELAETTKGTAKYPQLKKMARKLARKARKWNFRSTVGGFNMACKLSEWPQAKDFFAEFDKGNSQAQLIISELQKSWKIYCYNESGNYKQNNLTRIANMRSNFMRNYEALAEKEDRPKVVVKMGNYHTTKIKSPIDYEDVGQLLETIAQENNTKSVIFRMIRRFRQTKAGKIKDNLQASGRYANFLRLGRSDQWTLIDLQPLRKKIRNRELAMTKRERYEILNYDYMVIMPTDRRVDYHF